MYVKELKATYFIASMHEKGGENGPCRPSLLETYVFVGALRDKAVMMFHGADCIKMVHFLVYSGCICLTVYRIRIRII